MSKQANQRYRKELGTNHKERAKDNVKNQTTNNKNPSFKDMPSREGFGDGNADGSTDGSDCKY